MEFPRNGDGRRFGRGKVGLAWGGRPPVGKMLYTSLCAPYDGDNTMGELLERRKALIARHFATNS
jgi:hypothetical protein